MSTSTKETNAHLFTSTKISQNVKWKCSSLLNSKNYKLQFAVSKFSNVCPFPITNFRCNTTYHLQHLKAKRFFDESIEMYFFEFSNTDD